MEEFSILPSGASLVGWNVHQWVKGHEPDTWTDYIASPTERSVRNTQITASLLPVPVKFQVRGYSH